MTGAEAAEYMANKAERAAARPVIPRQNKSDGDDCILIPGTPRMRARSRASSRAAPALL
jgi:hypothetical protein